jgi:RNA polymerase-binding transcription factor DksA
VCELTLKIETLRPQVAVESAAEADYVAANRRLAAAEQTSIDIRTSLQRLDEGTYGYCAACMQSIPTARLELRPYTQRCVSCS